jgi:hypothetical protein
VTVAIVWDPVRFYWIAALPKGVNLNRDYSIFYVLDRLAECRRIQVWGMDRRLHVQADSVHPHTAKKVAELYVCGYIKGRIADASFEEPDQLLQAIDAIFKPVKKPH